MNMKIIVDNICDIMGKWLDIIKKSLGVAEINHIAAIVQYLLCSEFYFCRCSPAGDTAWNMIYEDNFPF